MIHLSESTWEPIGNLFCLDLVETFERHLAETTASDNPNNADDKVVNINVPQGVVSECDSSPDLTMAEALLSNDFGNSLASSIVNNQIDTMERIFFPVENCIDHNEQLSHGWNSISTLKKHLFEHNISRLDGKIPNTSLNIHNLTICPICYQTISAEFGGICKKCRPESRNHVLADISGEADNVKTVKFIPGTAKFLWTKCINQTMECIIKDNSVNSWKEFLMLPKSVLNISYKKGARQGLVRNENQRISSTLVTR